MENTDSLKVDKLSFQILQAEQEMIQSALKKPFMFSLPRLKTGKRSKSISGMGPWQVWAVRGWKRLKLKWDISTKNLSEAEFGAASDPHSNSATQRWLQTFNFTSPTAQNFPKNRQERSVSHSALGLSLLQSQRCCCSDQSNFHYSHRDVLAPKLHHNHYFLKKQLKCLWPEKDEIRLFKQGKTPFIWKSFPTQQKALNRGCIREMQDEPNFTTDFLFFPLHE